MIIERKYVRFIDLINSDEKAKKVFLTAFEKSYQNETEKRKEEIFVSLTSQCLYQRDMGWCFKFLGDVIEEFEILDKCNPYDNGLNYGDVTKVEIVEREEDRLVVHLINVFDGMERIVSVKKIK